MSNQKFGNKVNGSKPELTTPLLKNKRIYIPNKGGKAKSNESDSIAAMFAQDKDINAGNKLESSVPVEQVSRPIAYRCQTVKGLTLNNQVSEVEIAFEAVFEDNELPSADTERKGFATMLASLQANDMVHIQSLFYLAQDMTELNARIKLILTAGASLYFVEEKLYFVSLDDMFTKQWMNITETINAFNAQARSMKHIKGIAKSRMQGGRTGRKQALSGARLQEFRNDAIVLGKVELMEKYGISAQTVWRYKNMTEDDAAKIIQMGKDQESSEIVA